MGSMAKSDTEGRGLRVMMGKYKTREAARLAAQEEGLSYGWSVLGGAYFIGTDVQLADVGVILRLRPDDESIRQDA